MLITVQQERVYGAALWLGVAQRYGVKLEA
jgi:hypothetical protein